MLSWAELQRIELHYIQPGKSNQGAFVEPFYRSVRQEVPNAWLFDSLAQAQQILEGWRIGYNTARSHEPLGEKTPWGICTGWLTPKPLLLICLLDAEVRLTTSLRFLVLFFYFCVLTIFNGGKRTSFLDCQHVQPVVALTVSINFNFLAFRQIHEEQRNDENRTGNAKPDIFSCFVGLWN